MKKNIEITLDTAKQMYASGIEALVKLAKDNFSEDELKGPILREWDYIVYGQSGFIVDSDNASIDSINVISPDKSYLDVFKTKAMAKKALAMAQLEWLVADANNGWVPDWEGSCVNIYVIHSVKNKVRLDVYKHINCLLAFENETTRNLFYEKHKDLIHDYLLISQ